jgi:plastocyanin
LLDAGKSCTITFKKAGTIKYHCSIHATMLGTVEVK